MNWPALILPPLLCAVAGAAFAQQPDPLRARVEAAPREVSSFIGRRANCNHWGGEEGWDADRELEIQQAVRELRCNRLDRDLAALQRRYRGRPAILRLLRDTRTFSAGEVHCTKGSGPETYVAASPEPSGVLAVMGAGGDDKKRAAPVGAALKSLGEDA